MNLDIKNKLGNFTGDTNKRYIYRDINYDERGINYNSFFKLRFDTINLLHIKNKYSVVGWYILCYLITKAKDYKYISISPRIIAYELNLTLKSIYKALNKLFENKIIQGYINKKEYSNKTLVKKVDDVIDIIILYADDNIYNYNDRGGYKPIPLDFISKTIKGLTAEEWGVYCVLLVRHRYFLIQPTITEEGKLINDIKDCGYAFPQQEKIAESLGINKRTVVDAIKGLVDKKLISIEFNNYAPKTKVNDTIKHKDCYRYYIKLLNKHEYIYHYILKLEDTPNELAAKKSGIKNYINKNINLNPDLITNKIYFYSICNVKLTIEKYYNEY